MIQLSLFLLLSLCSVAFSSQNLIDSSIDMKELQQAWEYCTGGNFNKSYYRVKVNGKTLNGSRDWLLRWNQIKSSLDFKGKTILDLGCNNTISSSFLVKYRGAQSATAVDLPEESLKNTNRRGIYKSAKHLHNALGINSVKLRPLDFNKDNYEKILGYEYDLVICMSILKWIKDKNRFLSFLSNFDHIIFEGHRDLKSELETFKKIGFKYYKVLESHTTYPHKHPNYKRPLILFSKSK